MVEDQLNIDLGGRILALTAHQNAHTRHDLSIFDSKTETLITGDLVFIDHCPALDGELLGWQKVLAQIRAMNFKRLIPGHGKVQTNKQGLDKQINYLAQLRQQVGLAVRNQLDINSAAETIMAEQHDQWRLFDVFHRRNVVLAYTQLEWEE